MKKDIEKLMGKITRPPCWHHNYSTKCTDGCCMDCMKLEYCVGVWKRQLEKGGDRNKIGTKCNKRNGMKAWCSAAFTFSLESKQAKELLGNMFDPSEVNTP